jgi:hypothetical protein
MKNRSALSLALSHRPVLLFATSPSDIQPTYITWKLCCRHLLNHINRTFVLSQATSDHPPVHYAPLPPRSGCFRLGDDCKPLPMWGRLRLRGPRQLQLPVTRSGVSARRLLSQLRVHGRERRTVYPCVCISLRLTLSFPRTTRVQLAFDASIDCAHCWPLSTQGY